MKTVFGYLRPYFKKMGFGFTFKALGAAAELMLPYLLSYILKDVITRTYRDIVFWGVLMIVFAAVACICNCIANRVSSRVSKDFTENLRRDLFKATLRLSAAQTDRYTIPSLESRITTDTYHVHGFAMTAQRLGVRAPLLLLGGIIITMFMDMRLSLIMLAMLPVICVTIYFIRKKGVPLYAEVQRASDDMISVVREDTKGMRVIKALSKDAYEHARYEEVNKTLIKNELRAGLIMSSVNPAMNFFMNLGIIAVIALGAIFVSKGVSDPETIIAFMQYFTIISTAMMSVTRIFVMYTRCAASAGRIEEVLLTAEDLPVRNKSEFPDKKSDAHIVFDNVTFSYNGKRNNLDGLDFSAKRGQHIGIIGATGSGKSTAVQLLLRFYDPDSGRILINGEDVRTIDRDRLYSMFGSALQNDFLYSETITENIKFGRDISDEAVVKAAKTAQADGFISEFPDGYDHILSPHGTNISGGQKQRILIARALAGQPEILILDDSSSALDYKTDAALRLALSKELENTTVITVAQRISTVKDCDLIIVLDYGKTIGMGTHDELMESCPEYREISESQMGGAFVE